MIGWTWLCNQPQCKETVCLQNESFYGRLNWSYLRILFHIRICTVFPWSVRFLCAHLGKKFYRMLSDNTGKFCFWFHCVFQNDFPARNETWKFWGKLGTESLWFLSGFLGERASCCLCWIILSICRIGNFVL